MGRRPTPFAYDATSSSSSYSPVTGGHRRTGLGRSEREGARGSGHCGAVQETAVNEHLRLKIRCYLQGAFPRGHEVDVRLVRKTYLARSSSTLSMWTGDEAEEKTAALLDGFFDNETQGRRTLCVVRLGENGLEARSHNLNFRCSIDRLALVVVEPLPSYAVVYDVTSVELKSLARWQEGGRGGAEARGTAEPPPFASDSACRVTRWTRPSM